MSDGKFKTSDNCEISYTVHAAPGKPRLALIHSLAEPMSDVRGSAAYKREMAVEFSYRALFKALQRAAGPEKA